MRTTHGRSARLICVSYFALLPVVGCAEEASNTALEVRSALNGTINFVAFDPVANPLCAQNQGAFRSKFTSAFTQHLVPLIVNNPSQLLLCLKDAILSGEVRFVEQNGRHADVQYPENIVLGMRENVPTNISCADSLGGPVCGSGGGENFVCRASIAESTVEDIAVIAAHEIAHKAWDHPFGIDHPNAVNMQMEKCVRDFAQGIAPSPNGRRRSQLNSAEVAMSQVGRELGTVAMPTYCALGRAISGFHGRLDAITGILGLGGVCKDLNTFATSQMTITGSSSAGTSFSDLCPSDQLAVGAAGTADDMVRSIGSFCAPKASVQGGLVTFSRNPLRGLTIGGSWERQCPRFHALKGLRMRGSSATVPRIEAVCQDVRDGKAVDQTALSRAGNAGQYRYLETCQTRGVMSGIASGSDDAAWVRSGGWCANVWNSSPFPFETIGPGEHIMPSHGGASVGGVLDRCPTGHALVGIRAHLNSLQLVGVEGRCAELTSWATGAATTPQSSLPLHGQSGTTVERLCPSGKFMNGWFIDTDLRVRGIAPLCRQVGSGTLANMEEIFQASIVTFSALLI